MHAVMPIRLTRRGLQINIPSAHERRQNPVLDRSISTPNFHPLSRGDISFLLLAAKKAAALHDAAGRLMVSQIHIRFCQAIPGLENPLAPDGLVAIKDHRISTLFTDFLEDSRPNPRLAEKIYRALYK